MPAPRRRKIAETRGLALANLRGQRLGVLDLRYRRNPSHT
jgi:hypothetical protein